MTNPNGKRTADVYQYLVTQYRDNDPEVFASLEFTLPSGKTALFERASPWVQNPLGEPSEKADVVVFPSPVKQRITDVREVPVTERHGVWARWNPDLRKEYLYLTESDIGPAWNTCLRVEGEVTTVLPKSLPPPDL